MAFAAMRKQPASFPAPRRLGARSGLGAVCAKPQAQAKRRAHAARRPPIATGQPRRSVGARVSRHPFARMIQIQRKALEAGFEAAGWRASSRPGRALCADAGSVIARRLSTSTPRARFPSSSRAKKNARARRAQSAGNRAAAAPKPWLRARFRLRRRAAHHSSSTSANPTFAPLTARQLSPSILELDRRSNCWMNLS